MGHPAPFSVFLFFLFFPPPKRPLMKETPPPASASSPAVRFSRCHRLTSPSSPSSRGGARGCHGDGVRVLVFLPVRMLQLCCKVQQQQQHERMIKIHVHVQVAVRFVLAACRINVIALSELKKTCRQNS